VFYAAAAVLVGYFAAHPAYRQLPAGMAQVKLSFRHGAQRVEDCRRLTPEEIAKLPPRERRPNTCSRARLPIAVQLTLDGRVIYDAVLEPTGFARDGPADAYEKFTVPAGRHTLIAKLRDSKRTRGFDFERRTEIELKPMQNFAVDFKADLGGFLFR
jgi:hypothetical protein